MRQEEEPYYAVEDEEADALSLKSDNQVTFSMLSQPLKLAAIGGLVYLFLVLITFIARIIVGFTI